MEASRYCEVNKIDAELIPLMKEMRTALWHLFLSKEKAFWVTDTRHKSLKTGFYSFTGPKPKRESYQKEVIAACEKAGFIYEAKNISGRKGALGERLIIFY